MALSSDTETGTWQWTNEVFEAKAKSPIGGGGGSCLDGTPALRHWTNEKAANAWAWRGV